MTQVLVRAELTQVKVCSKNNTLGGVCIYMVSDNLRENDHHTCYHHGGWDSGIRYLFDFPYINSLLEKDQVRWRCPVKYTKHAAIPDENVPCKYKENLGPYYKPTFSLQNSLRKLKFLKCLHIPENVT